MAPRNNSTVLNLLVKDKPVDDVPKLPDDEGQDVKPDPKPGGRRKAPIRANNPTRTQVKQVADELEVLFKVGAGAWSVRDPHCGPVLNKQAREIADEVAELLSTNATVMRWFDEAVGISGWVKLFKAVQPVFVAFYAHHISKKAGHEEEETNAPDPLGRFAPWSPGVAATA